MTREEARQLLPVIQAWADGKTVQSRCSLEVEWYDTNNPTWNIECYYRIKPELLEKWMNVYDDGSYGIYETEAQAKEDAIGVLEETEVKIVRTVNLREVVP